MRMAERIAAVVDAKRYGVEAMWVFGSTKNASAGPASDIDLLFQVDGDDRQRSELAVWLDGWSRSLAEINYLRTGHLCRGLLDVHYITGRDLAEQTPYAAKVGATTDPARPLALGGTASGGTACAIGDGSSRSA